MTAHANASNDGSVTVSVDSIPVAILDERFASPSDPENVAPVPSCVKPAGRSVVSAPIPAGCVPPAAYTDAISASPGLGVHARLKLNVLAGAAVPELACVMHLMLGCDAIGEPAGVAVGAGVGAGVGVGVAFEPGAIRTICATPAAVARLPPL